MRTGTLIAFSSLALVACGDDDSGSKSDTSTTTATTATTSEADTTSSEEDTTVATTEETDTAVTTEQPDTVTPQKCGCEGGSTCLQATEPDSCASLGGICGGGTLHLVDNCSTDDVMMTCEHESTTTYLYYARIADWVANAAEDCASTVPGPAGAFTLTPVPTPAGDVCSCQRSASACTQGVGEDVCGTITCEAEGGLQASACTETDRVPGRCVTRDGKRELMFYGISASIAEQTCLAASVAEYYWYPPDVSF